MVSASLIITIRESITLTAEYKCTLAVHVIEALVEVISENVHGIEIIGRIYAYAAECINDILKT